MSVSALLALLIVPTVVQALPSLEYCQAPSAASAVYAAIATPARVLAEEPPDTASVVSLKFPPNKVLTVDAVGLAASSRSVVRLALPLATGASFTAVTVIATVSVSVSVPPVPVLPLSLVTMVSVSLPL